MNLSRIADELIVIGAAVAAPVDALLIEQGAFTATTGGLVGGIVTAFVAAWRAKGLQAASGASVATPPPDEPA